MKKSLCTIGFYDIHDTNDIDTLNRILAENTGKSIEEIARDTDRDNFMTADQALAYGLVDKVLAKRN